VYGFSDKNHYITERIRKTRLIGSELLISFFNYRAYHICIVIVLTTFQGWNSSNPENIKA